MKIYSYHYFQDPTLPTSFRIKITGSFEGWVPTPQDLYYKGNNLAGFTVSDAQFQNTQIVFPIAGTLRLNPILNTTKIIDVRSYTNLVFEGTLKPFSVSNGFIQGFEIPTDIGTISTLSNTSNGLNQSIHTVNISQAKQIVIGKISTQYRGTITRIRLS